jgi:hypothetical protein
MNVVKKSNHLRPTYLGGRELWLGGRSNRVQSVNRILLFHVFWIQSLFSTAVCNEFPKIALLWKPALIHS